MAARVEEYGRLVVMTILGLVIMAMLYLTERKQLTIEKEAHNKVRRSQPIAQTHSGE